MKRFLVLCLGAMLAPAFAAENSQEAAERGLLQQNPGVRFFRLGDYITRVYGPAFSSGESAEASTDAFITKWAGVLGADAADLSTVGPLEDGRHSTGLMFDPETGLYKFTLVYYTQWRDGVPVFRSDVRLLVRNEIGFPLVLVSNGLRPLGDFRVDSAVLSNPAAGAAIEAATRLHPDLINWTEPEAAIWAGVNTTNESPRLALVFIGDNNMYATPEYAKRLFVADAATGDVLYDENQICYTDVNGTVTGKTTDNTKAAFCTGVTPIAFKYSKVSIGSTTVNTDANGNFTIPNAGTDPVTVTAEVRGTYFQVLNQTGSNTILSLTVTPPGPANFIFNEQNNAELTVSEVNCYYHANVIRDFLLSYNPTYPTISTQTNFAVKHMWNSTCNAYYDGSSINFFRAGGGCPNTGYSTIVHHEYGHHMVATAGSGQGAYGEGYSDVMGVVITDESELAWGFFNDCNQPLRDADNTKQYPCNGEIHDCGQLLSGCVWSTRNQLLATHPDTYRTIISNLVVNSPLMHTGDGIAPDITIDFLTLDDDNGNIADGTPHYFEIADGFGAHNMDAPELDLMKWEYPNGLPGVISSTGNGRVRVRPVGIATQPEPGTGKLHYRLLPTDPFTVVDMEQVNSNPIEYDAIFPAVDCGSRIEYYVSTDATNGSNILDPVDAPFNVFSVVAGKHPIVLFHDNFETDQGWAVRNHTITVGKWERGVPIPGNGAPPADYDGSGQCFVTGLSANQDVDGGPTRLFSPKFDLTPTEQYAVSYARWLRQFDAVDDEFEVRVSNNNGLSWQPVFQALNSRNWIVQSFVLNDYVDPAEKTQVRFAARDDNNNGTVEAGIDRFFLHRFDCGPDFPKGDMNCDGSINGFDIAHFVQALSDPAGYNASHPDCFIGNGDFTADGSVNGFDIAGFVDALTP